MPGRAARLGVACFAAAGVLLLRPDAARAGSAPADSLAATPAVPRSDSVAAPDPTRLAEIQLALERYHDIQVFFGPENLLGHRATASSDGISIQTRYSGISNVRATSEERAYSWSEMDSVRVRRAGHGIGPIVGGVVGFSVGVGVAISESPDSVLPGGEGPNGVPILLGLVAGTGLGYLIDHAGPWHRVYP